MLTIKAFIISHAVLTYFMLTLAISWGSALVILGPGVFLGTKVVSFVGEGPIAYLGFLAGPCVAGILMAGLVNGRAGLRDVLARLCKWRVGVRWYAVALLTAPLLTTATLFALSLTSPVFLPTILATEDKASMLVPGLVVGLVVPFFEEFGWTGFAIPQLRKRYGILASGLSVGLLWGAWHFPLFAASASSSGAIPPALYVAVLLFSWLPPYRVLMALVYEHTKSLFLAMVIHMPIVVSQFVLRPAAASGVDLLVQLIMFSVGLWFVVALIAVVDGRQVSRQSLERGMA